MKSCLPHLLLLSIFAATGALAKPPGKGPGRGEGDFRGVIHSLFAAHEDFTRKVELLENGYRAETVSENPDSARFLQKHVAQMEERLEGGMGVRQWDPAFAELRAHYEDMVIEVKDIEKGVAVSVIGKTPEAIKVAHNHARIVSGFIDEGKSRMHATHPAVANAEGAENVQKGRAKSEASACSCSRSKGNGKGGKNGETRCEKCEGVCSKNSQKTNSKETDSE